MALDDSDHLISISPALLIARQRRAEVLMNLADCRGRGRTQEDSG